MDPLMRKIFARVGFLQGRLWKDYSDETQLFFSENPVTDLVSAEKSSTRLFSIFHQEARKEGLLLPPSQFEALFLSTCHDDRILSLAIPRFRAAIGRTRDQA